VQEIADRFTVLRDGQSVGGGAVSQFSPEKIIELMVGRSLTDQFPRVPHGIGEPILELTDLAGRELPRGVNLKLHRGKILYIAVIVCAGRTEMLRAIFGLDPVRCGKVVIAAHLRSAATDGTRIKHGNQCESEVARSGDRATTWGTTPRRRIEQGMGMLSEDRKSEGLALIQSI